MQVGRWRWLEVRVFISQLLATSVKNLLLLNFGMSIGFVILLTGVLHNAEEGLSLDDDQVGWFAGLLSIGQPLGSVVSGPIVEFFGRKRTLMLITVPCAVSWLLLYLASTPAMIFLGTVTCGACIGLQEAPVKTYAGEVCTPAYRGMLGAYSGLFMSFGELAVYLVAAKVSWRSVAVFGLCVSVFTGLCLAMVPESPDWLVAKGRIRDADKSLRWLRGWVQSSAVKEELRRIVRYHERKRQYNRVASDGTQCALGNIGEEHLARRRSSLSLAELRHEEEEMLHENEPLGARIRALWEPTTRRPAALVLVCVLIVVLSSAAGPNHYLLHIGDQLKWPLDKHWTTVVKASVSLVTIALTTCLIPLLGKRVVYLTSLAGLATGNALVGAYAYADPGPDYDHTRWILLVLYESLTAFTYLGAYCIPFLLLSEVFPYRTRGLICGLVTPVTHLMIFAVLRSYLPLEKAITLPGIFWLNGVCALLGLVYVYCWLPETEGRTLHEIEAFFAKGGRPNRAERSLRRRDSLLDSHSEHRN